MRPKLKTNYGYLSEKELATLATRTTDALRTNTSFPAMDPPFADYEPVALDYVLKHGIASKRGSGMQIEEKNEARTALLEMMRRVTSYMNNQPGVISSILLGSGFFLVDPPQTTLTPDVPEWLRVHESRQPGMMGVDFQGFRAARDYEFAVATELDGEGQPIWENVYQTTQSRGNTFGPITDGVTYYVKVRARNAKGFSAWSHVVSLRARL